MIRGCFHLFQRQIEENGIEQGELELEITEYAVVEDFLESVSRLNNLKQLGISVTMDDFGTGYSSLNYLKKLPIETMKIDPEFYLPFTCGSGGFCNRYCYFCYG